MSSVISNNTTDFHLSVSGLLGFQKCLWGPQIIHVFIIALERERGRGEREIEIEILHLHFSKPELVLEIRELSICPSNEIPAFKNTDICFFILKNCRPDLRVKDPVM